MTKELGYPSVLWMVLTEGGAAEGLFQQSNAAANTSRSGSIPRYSPAYGTNMPLLVEMGLRLIIAGNSVPLRRLP